MGEWGGGSFCWYLVLGSFLFKPNFKFFRMNIIFKLVTNLLSINLSLFNSAYLA